MVDWQWLINGGLPPWGYETPSPPSPSAARNRVGPAFSRVRTCNPAAARARAGRRRDEIVVGLVVRRGRQKRRSQRVPGFVPAGNGIVPDIALFLVL